MGFKINKQISTSKANVIHQFYDLLAKVAMFPGNVSFLYHKACTYNARVFFSASLNLLPLLVGIIWH